MRDEAQVGATFAKKVFSLNEFEWSFSMTIDLSVSIADVKKWFTGNMPIIRSCDQL